MVPKRPRLEPKRGPGMATMSPLNPPPAAIHVKSGKRGKFFFFLFWALYVSEMDVFDPLPSMQFKLCASAEEFSILYLCRTL